MPQVMISPHLATVMIRSANNFTNKVKIWKTMKWKMTNTKTMNMKSMRYKMMIWNNTMMMPWLSCKTAFRKMIDCSIRQMSTDIDRHRRINWLMNMLRFKSQTIAPCISSPPKQRPQRPSNKPSVIQSILKTLSAKMLTIYNNRIQSENRKRSWKFAIGTLKIGAI